MSEHLLGTGPPPTDAGRRPRPGLGCFGTKRQISLNQESRLRIDAADDRPGNNVLRFVFDGQGDLDVCAFEHAVRDVLTRHEVLRTLFDRTHLVGWLLPLPERVVEVVETSTPEAADRRIEEFLGRPFDLDRDLPIRLMLVRTGPGRRSLGLAVEHIVFDRLSMSVLLSEISQAYRLRLEGSRWEPAPLPYQFADFAVAQRVVANAVMPRQSPEYWRELRGSGPYPPLRLPCLPGRLATELGGESIAASRLGPSQYGQMVQWLQSRDVSLFHLLLVALARSVTRLFGERLLGVVTVHHGRNWYRAAELIGFFANPMVVHLGELPNDGIEAVTAVRAATDAAVARADIPFGEMLRVLHPHTGGRGPDVPYVFLDVVDRDGDDTQSWSIPGCRWSQQLSVRARRRIHPGIDVVGEVRRGALTLTIRYASGVLDAREMRRLAAAVLREGAHVCGVAMRADTGASSGGSYEQ